MAKPTAGTVWVYIIACGDQVKIGMSNDPEKRFKELATGMPSKPILFHKRPFSNRADAREIEKQMHWKFRANKSHREWFTVTAQQVKNALKAATLRRHQQGTASQRVTAILESMKEQLDILP